MNNDLNQDLILQAVQATLKEDIGSGDVTSALISDDCKMHAQIIAKENAILCGIPWVEAVYGLLDSSVNCTWHVLEGDSISPNQVVADINGYARSILSGERSAINWLQTLSGAATIAKRYVDVLKGTNTQLLDTRKTIPGLRYAQKYAVRCAGATNHRMGLYDAFLIKENHIAAHQSITHVIRAARDLHPALTLEIEVENLKQFQEALSAKPDIIMLDEFSFSDIEKAVLLNQHQVKLEVSGNVEIEKLKTLAELGIDYISVGALTKHVRAIDFSMLTDEVNKL